MRIATPDLKHPRIDLVVIENGNTKIIQGVPCKNPEPPLLIKTELINQTRLAEIYVRPGANNITIENIKYPEKLMQNDIKRIFTVVLTTLIYLLIAILIIRLIVWAALPLFGG